MSPPVISVENLSKAYRLGQVDTGAFPRGLEVWWAKLRGAWRLIPCFDTVSERRTVSASLRIGEKDYARDEYGIINVYGK